MTINFRVYSILIVLMDLTSCKTSELAESPISSDSMPTVGPTSNRTLLILSGQSNMVRLNPEVHLLPRLRQAATAKTYQYTKVACDGQPIRRWDHEWMRFGGAPNDRSASYLGFNCKQSTAPVDGDLMAALIKSVRDQSAAGRVDSYVLVWMQGEADAVLGWHAQYEKAFLRVIATLRDEVAPRPLHVVVGRINDHKLRSRKYPSWDLIRSAQERVVKQLKNTNLPATLVNTDSFNGPSNSLHFDEGRNASGYLELGAAFAEAIIGLLDGHP